MIPVGAGRNWAAMPQPIIIMTGEMIAPPLWRVPIALAILLLAAAGPAHAAQACPAVMPVATVQPGAGAAPAATPAAIPAVPALPSLTDVIQVSSGEETVDADGNIELEGDVQLHSGARTLRASSARYTRASQSFKLLGDVQYTDPGLRVSGATGSYDAAGAVFTHARFAMLQHPGRGQADTIGMAAPDLVELDGVTYTTCPEGVADWALRARHITLDTHLLRGVARDTRVEFKGVPIVYLPWISFPLSSARQSGFLFPSLGSSSSSGTTLAVPWYWNLAPNQDLTFTPKFLSRRGLDLGSEYRLLEPSGSGTLAVNYLPGDRLARSEPLLPNQPDSRTLSDSNRAWERLNLAANLPDQWRTTVHLENVSDTLYFADFAEGLQATSTTFLPRDMRLSYRDDAYQLGAQLIRYQTLDDMLASADRPYAEWPRLTGAAHWSGAAGLGAFAEGEVVDFQRSDGLRGWRGHLQPGVTLDYTRPGFYVRPQASWDLTAYRLSDGGQAGTVNLNATRSVPVLILDSALQLERSVGSDAGRLVTLEPRLYYVYVPYRNQDALPVFDSGVPDPNLVSLFRPNRFVGLDRLGDANTVTVGVTAHMLQSSTGQQYLSATIGQALNFSQPRVLLPGETADTSRRSDLIADIDLAAYRHWTLRYDLAWNPSLARTEKELLTLQYRPAGNQVINLGYRFNRGSIDQADASVAWPVARHWDLYGRAVYSYFTSNTPSATPGPASSTAAAGAVAQRPGSIEDFLGLQYRGGCWGLRLVARNSVTRTGGRESAWILQLELNGLSSVGSGADSFLQGEIQGYSPATLSH